MLPRAGGSIRLGCCANPPAGSTRDMPAAGFVRQGAGAAPGVVLRAYATLRAAVVGGFPAGGLRQSPVSYATSSRRSSLSGSIGSLKTRRRIAGPSVLSWIAIAFSGGRRGWRSRYSRSALCQAGGEPRVRSPRMRDPASGSPSPAAFLHPPTDGDPVPLQPAPR
jgi:hypothetical protein